MKKVMIEFPVVGYHEMVIEVEDDMTSADILAAIDDGDIEIVYDGHSHTESLRPLMHVDEASLLMDIPMSLQIVED